MRKLLPFLLFAAVLPAHADGIFFSNVVVGNPSFADLVTENPNTTIDLFSNPGIQLHPDSLGLLDFTLLLTNTNTVISPVELQASLFLNGAILQEAPGNFSPSLELGGLHMFPGAQNGVLLVFGPFDCCYLTPQPLDLHIDLLNSNPDYILPSTGQAVNGFDFPFSFVQPVPEPASLVLFASGLAGIGAVVRQRRRKLLRASKA
jgi:hypothetical protein